MTKKKQLGDQAEQFVTDHYIKNGYSVLSRNFRTRLGEIDIVVDNGEVVAVVEVKARHIATSIPIEEIITIQKRKKIRAAAIVFLRQHNLLERVIRFDVALVSYDDEMMSCKILESAFE